MSEQTKKENNVLKFIKSIIPGLLLCLCIAVPAWFLGKAFPIIGGAVISIVLGMVVTLFIKDKSRLEGGIKFTSKKVLQWAVVLLGFGMNLSVIAQTGAQSLPIIVSTIATSLIVAFVLCRAMKIPSKIATLIGVGSSICGGSAIAAAAPVIDADDEEVAQSISVIFLFNVLAALIFPPLGTVLGFSQTDPTGFGVFAGTAVNDTSSVTAAASTWDSLCNLGTATLDIAVTVKLTRTLAIIPITLVLAFIRARKAKREGGESKKVNFSKIFPFFILYFIAASVITTVVYAIIGDNSAASSVAGDIFGFIKNVSKFFIVLAMAAIGLNTNVVKLIKTGAKPIALGACCWVAITSVSLVMQKVMGIW